MEFDVRVPAPRRNEGEQAPHFPDAGGPFAAERAARPRGAQDPPAGPSWVIVLAGGEGERIRAFTRARDGTPVPKQFCRFRDHRTLLATTIERARQLVPRERVVVVVLEAHRRWWEPEVGGVPPENVISQPLARGTAVAILLAIDHVLGRDPGARVVVMPSDHDVEDESVLLGSIRTATRASSVFPEDVLLLGFVPTEPDAEYGLIVPRGGGPASGRRVEAFVEKPPAIVGRQLIRRGALWNSFILACNAVGLARLYERALPLLLEAYRRGIGLAHARQRSPGRYFERLPERDFSRDLLQPSAARLRLLAVPPCGWTDLGTPARLSAWLHAHRQARFWREYDASALVRSLDLSGLSRP